jgi:hypothetical protein
MLSLAYDRRNRVLRVTASGILASEDLEELDRVVIGFVARHGQVRSIFDCSEVEAFALPESLMIQRAQQPLILHERVLVGSRAAVDAVRLFRRHQREAGKKEATLVDSLDEAYAFLRLRKPRFEPVES